MVKTTSTKATKPAATKPKNVTKKAAVEPAKKQTSLGRFLHEHGHALLSFIYAVQALLVLLLAKTYTVAITNSFIAKDTLASSTAGETVLQSASRHLMDVNVGYLAAGVLLIAAVTHLVLAIIRKRDTWSDTTIIRHGRRVRWTGLTFSVVGLVVLVALLVGVRDIAALAALKMLLVTAGVVGYLADEHQLISRRILLLLGVITVIIPVAILGVSTLHSSLYGELTGLTLGAAAVLLLGLVTLFSAFYYAANAKNPAKFSRSAFVSITLLLIESAIVWQIFAGFLRA